MPPGQIEFAQPTLKTSIITMRTGLSRSHNNNLRLQRALGYLKPNNRLEIRNTETFRASSKQV
jgi:hypothetical protein